MKPYFETKNGKLYNMDCLEMLRQMPENSVDLTVTSPPYDNLRTYNGYSFDFEGIAKELYRVTKQGGVAVWVVGDATINGSETLTSFKQALYFKEQCGFNMHDTMIYQKDVMPFPEQKRYNHCFEYMFVLSKGRPIVFNPIKERTKGYKGSTTSTTRSPNGETVALKYEQGKEFRSLFNIWQFSCGFNKSTNDQIAFQHPAIYPEKLVKNHIISWSNEGDLVFDPFIGSGTTAKIAEILDRKWLGCEISKEYCQIAADRIAKAADGFNYEKEIVTKEKPENSLFS